MQNKCNSDTNYCVTDVNLGLRVPSKNKSFKNNFLLDYGVPS